MRAGEVLAIAAAVENNRAKLIQALAIQPACPSFKQAKRVVEVLCEELCLSLD